ncbi:unnamed protein product [Rotaria sordida]|uniref:Uncharacterized protein n=1 Tax=Rotaria sordida TaxID=392033 RepID=A0A819M6J3_9BILA|nr:unnamed protein product [Rotaria sordida]CAF1446566.1 unnamed protein product [Rotaria sordida]CAF3957115.1 unnamed protein product [Rotaria sordida]CAF3974492.1 unnamed protein product [Rotaria sordida]
MEMDKITKEYDNIREPKNITDKDLIELSDNLHTMPDVDEKLIELIQFSQLKLEFDELLPTKKFIHLSDFQEINNKDDKSINNNEENDCISP